MCYVVSNGVWMKSGVLTLVHRFFYYLISQAGGKNPPLKYKVLFSSETVDSKQAEWGVAGDSICTYRRRKNTSLDLESLVQTELLLWFYFRAKWCMLASRNQIAWGFFFSFSWRKSRYLGEGRVGKAATSPFQTSRTWVLIIGEKKLQAEKE